MRSAANTWVRSSTSGISVADAAPTQSQSVETEVDAFPPIGHALAVERQVQAVFAEQDVREQHRPDASARSDSTARGSARWSRRSGRRTSHVRAGSLSTAPAYAPASRSRPRRSCAASCRRSTGTPSAPDARGARAADRRATNGRRAGCGLAQAVHAPLIRRRNGTCGV
jgi:hypothetical protein